MSNSQNKTVNKPTIKLRIYKGTSINYDENRNVKNENQLVTLIHDTIEWHTYLKHIRLHGLCKVEIEKVFNGSTEIEIPESYKEEVKKAFLGDQEVKLTPEQKEIAELKEQVAKLMNVNKGSSSDSKDADLLENARAEYEKLFGKKPQHKKKLETILEEIAKFKNK